MERVIHRDRFLKRKDPQSLLKGKPMEVELLDKDYKTYKGYRYKGYGSDVCWVWVLWREKKMLLQSRNQLEQRIMERLAISERVWVPGEFFNGMIRIHGRDFEGHGAPK